MSNEASTQSANWLYRAMWRFHFYAGIYVIPFVVMLALTGLVMVLHHQIEEVQYRDKIFVSAESEALPPSAQLLAVKTAYGDGSVGQYIPPTAPDRSSQFSVTTADDQTLTVFVNPYTAEVLGEVDVSTMWYTIANEIHGSLLLGDYGDYAIEVAAGFGILLVITGVAMWWVQRKQKAIQLKGRPWWRNWHATTGLFVGVPMLFFLLSGLTWTGVWGSKLVQAWNSFPGDKWEMQSTVPAKTHSSLNHLNLEEVPWSLEQTPMPASQVQKNSEAITAPTIDSVVAYASEVGFTFYRVNLPSGDTGVWTISADTMSGDIKNPLEDRTVHLDQYTGEKLADIGFADYSALGKAMAAGIALHQGDAGVVNLVFNVVFCLTVLFMAVSGVIMWWLRRPKGVVRVVAPPALNLPFWKGMTPVILVLSLLFPLSAVALIFVLLLDWLVLSRVPALKQFFN
jgi:uncharacterized iron-regulated membrane protein